MFEIKNKRQLSAAEVKPFDDRKKRRGKYYELDLRLDKMQVEDVYIDDFDGHYSIDEVETLTRQVRQHLAKRDEKYDTVCGIIDGKTCILIERTA